MKTILWFAMLVLIKTTLAQTQSPIVRGYAFLRASIPGVAPKGISSETGSEINRARTYAGTYLIFLEYNRAENIRPVCVWINQKGYKVKYDNISDSAVRALSDTAAHAKVDTLPDMRNNLLMQIHLNGESDGKKIKLATNENVVIEYYWRGKRHLFTIEEIKKDTAILE